MFEMRFQAVLSIFFGCVIHAGVVGGMKQQGRHRGLLAILLCGAGLRKGLEVDGAVEGDAGCCRDDGRAASGGAHRSHLNGLRLRLLLLLLLPDIGFLPRARHGLLAFAFVPHFRVVGLARPRCVW